MSEDDTDAAWAHQEELERRSLEEQWQATRAACHAVWKAQIEALALGKEKEYGDHGG